MLDNEIGFLEVQRRSLLGLGRDRGMTVIGGCKISIHVTDCLMAPA
jgi:hypothetical protein